jgi:hypothetical protein
MGLTASPFPESSLDNGHSESRLFSELWDVGGLIIKNPEKNLREKCPISRFDPVYSTKLNEDGLCYFRLNIQSSPVII